MDMISAKINLAGLRALVQKYPEASRKAQVSRLTEALVLLEHEIQKATPVGAGPIHARDTIFHQVQMGEPMRGLVSTPAVYGLPLELGTKPHFPPIAPLQHWVERVLGVDEKHSKGVAFLVARAISRRGTEGAEMFGKSLAKRRAQVMAILRRIPADIVKSTGGEG